MHRFAMKLKKLILGHTPKSKDLLEKNSIEPSLLKLLRLWTPNPGVRSSKPLGGSKVVLSFRGQTSEYREVQGTK